jgi:hypothetical protein
LSSPTKNEGRRSIAMIGISMPGRPKFQLGKIHPNFIDKRLAVHRSYLSDGGYRGRVEENPLIEPLDPRVQSDLMHQSRVLISELAAGTSPPKMSRKEKNYVELNNLSVEVGNAADMPASSSKREEIGSAYAHSFSSLSYKGFLGLG